MVLLTVVVAEVVCVADYVVVVFYTVFARPVCIKVTVYNVGYCYVSAVA